MKKLYLKPDAKVYVIETAQMIADSLGKNSTTAVNPGSSNVLSRGGSSWDDDDDE